MSTGRSLHFESASASLMQLTKQLQQQEDKVLQAQAAVDKRAEELDKQAEALAHEKLKMSAVGVADNDVLDLNVGGVSLSVKRATLTQVEGSHLASMFSGRWEDCLDHDSNGRIFLDFDPYSFQQILTMLRCRPFDLANNTVPPEAIITPDKLHAYKCLVDYLGLEGVCGAADESSTLPSDACQLTHVSDNAIVTQGMAKGQWGTCVSPTKNHYAVANAGPRMSEQQVYYIKLENSLFYRFVGIAKDTPTVAYDPGQSAYGWVRGGGSWAAGVARRNDHLPMPRMRNMILQVDMNTSCLACVDLVSPHSAHSIPGWKMPFSSSPGLADVVQQQFFSFQMIIETDGRSVILPVTDIDKALFADKSDFVVI